MKLIERRLELLKLEGDGFDRREITKQLAEKYQVSDRAVCYDFQRRERWQPTLTQIDDKKKLFYRILNRYEQIYRKASFIHLRSQNDNAKVGSLKVMLDATQRLHEAVGLEEKNMLPEEIRVVWGKGEEVRHDLAAYEEAIENAVAHDLAAKRARMEEVE